MTTATGYRVRKEYREEIAARQRARTEFTGVKSNDGSDAARYGYRPNYGKVGRPRPLLQTLFPLASLALAFVMVWAVSDRLAAIGDATSPFTSQDLLELAEGYQASLDTPTTAPASPTVSVATPASNNTALDTAPDLIAAPVIAAPDTIATPEPTSIEARGQAALATISYPWQELLPEWKIEFMPESMGLYGLTLVKDKRIEIYVRPFQQTELLAHVIAHELGHAVDVTMNNSRDRRRWEDSRGIDSEPWWPGSGATDFSTGAGDFAEAFAAWQVGDQSFRSTLANPPTPAQEALLAELSVG